MHLIWVGREECTRGRCRRLDPCRGVTEVCHVSRRHLLAADVLPSAHPVMCHAQARFNPLASGEPRQIETGLVLSESHGLLVCRELRGLSLQGLHAEEVAEGRDV